MTLNSENLFLDFLMDLLYISIVVVEAKALSSEAVDDIAAENITANNNPIIP